MQRMVIVTAAIAASMAAGCAEQPVDTSRVSYEAQTYLTQAQYDIDAADRLNVNTVRAHDEFSEAREAAARGDSDAALKFSVAADKDALAAIKKGK